ncbi:MAG: glycosyltransferase family 4 protein [Chitinophagaceae bacterium]
MKQKRIIVSVISDLVSDQRVHKVCTFLHSQNYSVTLIGRRFKQNLPLIKRVYTAERILCYFKKGFLQYAEFNLKLFFRLFRAKADLFLANDLDTLLPNFLHSKMRRRILVYDSHEYFTGVPELQNRPFVRKVWDFLERVLLPRIKYVYTVNQSIADLYYRQYNIRMLVILNVPYLSNETKTLSGIQFPADKKILLLQGAGINRQRGAEELLQSMSLLPENFLLVLIGGGDCWEALKRMSREMNLQNKICFIDKVPFEDLPDYTNQAHLGLSLDKTNYLNYRLSLPNKIFDYIHAGVPVLSSDVIEVKRILEKYNVGTIISEITPEAIAAKILEIFNNKPLYDQWKRNTGYASQELCWQNEEKKLCEFYAAIPIS